MKTWLTAAEIAALRLPGLPRSKRKINALAAREDWKSATSSGGEALCRRRGGRGGGLEYHVSVVDGWASGGRVIVRSVDLDDADLGELARQEQERDPATIHVFLTRLELSQLRSAAQAKHVPDSVMATSLLRYALHIAGALL